MKHTIADIISGVERKHDMVPCYGGGRIRSQKAIGHNSLADREVEIDEGEGINAILEEWDKFDRENPPMNSHDEATLLFKAITQAIYDGKIVKLREGGDGESNRKQEQKR